MMEQDLRGACTAALRLMSLLTHSESASCACIRGAGSRHGRCARSIAICGQRWIVRAVENLARQVSLSASHFSRAFKTSFGTTPHMYIIRLRLELAQRLMLTTQDSLSQIALLCGLADQAHLSKVFRLRGRRDPRCVIKRVR